MTDPLHDAVRALITTVKATMEWNVHDGDCASNQFDNRIKCDCSTGELF